MFDGRAGHVIAAALSMVSLFTSSSAVNAQGSGQLRIIVGTSVGGGYDIWARTIARHIGRQLPGNPAVITQNMPGAGGIIAANYLYETAPKDGSVIGSIPRDAAVSAIAGSNGARYDASKFGWLGTPTTETAICLAWDTAKVQTVEQLFKQELIVGDTGAGTGGRIYPLALTGLLNMKFKIITGFPGSVEVWLAIQRGEVDGICESLASVRNRDPHGIREGKIKILFQAGLERSNEPEVKDVPFIMDLATTEDQKQALRFLYAGQSFGRPFVAPPGLPAENLKGLQEAFGRTMKDPAFVADAEKQKLDLDPHTAAQLEGYVKDLYAIPKSVADKVATYMQ